MKAQVTAFVSRRWSVPESALRVEMEPLPGGLESAVALARISAEGAPRAIPHRLVVKQVRPGVTHEADVYAWLWRHLDSPPAVHLLGSETVGDAQYLYMEDADPVSIWPWRDTARVAAVCRALAHLHDHARVTAGDVAWDHEAELARSAAATLQLAAVAHDAAGVRCWRRLGSLRRVVAELPAIRSRLLGGELALIHGDMHPGNVCLRSAAAGPHVVLIDWGRARPGSPLEDVASWLHSLGCWEPVARRRHDSLVRAYLDSRRLPRPFTTDLRMDYCLASASNGLAGAIRYHLAVLAERTSSESARRDSQRALTAWERVVRQAAALLSRTSSRPSSAPARAN